MDIEKILRQNQNRVTPERVALFHFIKTKHIFSCHDIEKNFKNISRASIFRTLKLFLELGIIRKVEVGAKTMNYEINDVNNHHEHMKCKQCDSVITFDSGYICDKIFSEAKKIGFEIQSHNIGILGICKQCLEYNN